jgi:hypothetical protein
MNDIIFIFRNLLTVVFKGTWGFDGCMQEGVNFSVFKYDITLLFCESYVKVGEW